MKQPPDPPTHLILEQPLGIVVGLIVSEKVKIILTNFCEKGYWYKADIIISFKCNLISPYEYNWNNADLALNNNQFLTQICLFGHL